MTYYLTITKKDGELGFEFEARDFKEATAIATAFHAGYCFAEGLGWETSHFRINSLQTKRTRGTEYQRLMP